MVRFTSFLIALAIAVPAIADVTLVPGENQRWYKGVTHFHTLWSDGDTPPERAVAWYKDHGYDFISISDHNILLVGDKWFPISDDAKSRLTPAKVEEMVDTYGEDWVETRDNNGRQEMRLKTLTELEEKFGEPGEFLIIPGEEVTSKMAVHINAINIRGLIEPADGDSVTEIMKKNFANIEAHEKEHGIPVLAHINHPNWSSHNTAEEIIAVGGERMFEVYNGHAGVRNWGSEELNIVSTDELWDIILTLRLNEGDTDKPMYGVATDDAHEWYDVNASTPPGRGWVVVMAEKLDADTIVNAMKAGNFYASSGVQIDRIEVTDDEFKVTMKEEPGVVYTTQFYGSYKGVSTDSEPILDADGNEIRATRDYDDDLGQILFETTANPATYDITGNEMYVRAKVISSKDKAYPFKAGDKEMAWTQPVTVE